MGVKFKPSEKNKIYKRASMSTHIPVQKQALLHKEHTKARVVRLHQ